MRLRVHGYHGTSVEAARAIEREGFRASSRAFDWLGDGIYFWQAAPLRAWEWSSVTRSFGANAAVIGAALEFYTTECIDLLDIGWERALARAYRAFARASGDLGRPLPLQRGLAHGLDRAVMNFLVQDLARQGVVIRAVRGAFREGKPVFPRSAISSRAHVQIAVRDPALIVDIWRER